MNDNPLDELERPKRSAKGEAVAIMSMILGIMFLQALMAPGSGSS